ncbi:hypothetical protein EW145_g7760 [Phellinidium pouzarii]|uniref:O-methyltransferase domain-containing protein n=1 Tax=Phellinidium pouzarii TaxID=167371 RepID=A0A4S4KER2_9AGAM|nr:hypothetical protein EW145_g7760 [Phellinidium pouzarii]
MRALASHLKPSGVLLIADHIKSTKAYEFMAGLKHAAHADGFNEDTMCSIFDSAGLEQFSFRLTVSVGHDEYELIVSIGKGIKPAALTE